MSLSQHYEPIAVVTAKPSGGVDMFATQRMKSMLSSMCGRGKTAKQPVEAPVRISYDDQRQEDLPNLNGLCAIYSICAASDFLHKTTNSAGE
jgi:hypothetical protein